MNKSEINHFKSQVRMNTATICGLLRLCPSTALLVIFALVAAPRGFALTPRELSEALTNGTKITVIDVRTTDVFAKGHIPGAINVPASLCPTKNLPPLGRVVVYDAGLGTSLAPTAAKVLGAKPGIKAEVLEGGFAAWEAVTRQSTRGKGVDIEMLPYATYHEVKTNAVEDMVLVDLRKGGPQKAGAPDTDLATEFPQARVSKSPFGVKARKSGGVSPLLVLVDDGDGSAEEMARSLRAQGVTRFVVLAGGEEIIKRQGKPGLKRVGTTVTAPAASGNGN